MEGVVLPEVKRVQRFFFSQLEIQLILAKAQEPQRTWYGLAAETGLRAGELCGLTVDDIDIEPGNASSAAECMAWKTGRSEDRRLHQGCRAFTSSLRTFEDLLKVVASE